ncbi:MaoC family dehydratase N-terminal domain-containing protein [Microbacterium sp. X-17]|uniref:MaoC family dehydratase N-terminal domain-containing protein n=1 Tax=Microbacterium sp. X-17 TaxID=3144404 RepID=UPI0031F56C76
MTLDTAAIGTRFPSHTVEVERGRLRFFAKATGQTDPVYTDLDAARAAGHPDLVVPLTFLFCLNMERPDGSTQLEGLGIDPRSILHGEQAFDYDALAYAGDALTFTTEISDVYSKKNGQLDFVERITEVTRGGERIARLTATIVVPNRGQAA